jgi:hypothetical protein
MRLNRCQIIKYSGLSDSTYTDLSSCSWFRGIRVPFCVLWSFFRDAKRPRDCGSGDFIDEEIDELGDNVKG